MTDDNQIDRRLLIKAGAGLGVALTAAEAAAQPAATRTRYAIVGVGSRSQMYQGAIWGDYREHAVLPAICDSNPGRMANVRRRARAANASPPRAYAPQDFERMIRDQRIDRVIVTTIDGTHDDYIVRALNAGCDVYTEKPMTTTPEKAQRILDACRTSGKHIRVGFNYRYSPPRTQVKDLLMRGEIGDILSVDFHWLLNTNHGADYFRRWHSHKASSGGLMLHKASHHFDLVNWWLSGVPTTVRASGKKEFYTPATARRMGLSGAHERCRTCPEKAECTFFLDIEANPNMKALYADNEHYDGYFRDQCVWREEIDIEDTMNVLVDYDTGATLCYSLNACNAWEGYRIAFNGTKGRIEHNNVEQLYETRPDGTVSIGEGGNTTRIFPLRGPARDIEVTIGEGGHDGGDTPLLDGIFLPNPPADPYMRAADERSGAYAVLIGAAANQCFAGAGTVRLADLVTGLERPNYPAMPTRSDPVTMPPRVRQGG
jgi:predicted dehydrogenase